MRSNDASLYSKSILIRAIRATGKSSYRLAKVSGVDKSVIGRFLAGKTGMHTENLDKLAAVIDLHAAIEANGKKPKG